MVDWDKKWQLKMTENNLEMVDASRYMDDVRAFLFAVRMGWRWWEGDLHWCQEWEEEDKTSGKSDLSRTSDILQASMKDVYKFLNFTMEVAEDFEDHRLPTLDFKLWVMEKMWWSTHSLKKP